jgi:hypothetical protein
MFKKLFFGGLALVLALGLAFQAVPALAMSGSGGVTGDPKPVALAKIRNVTLLETNPYQLRIVGSLPSACHQLRVTTSPVGDDPQTSGPSPLYIWVRSVPLSGVACSPSPKAFVATVTLDPVKLNLAPGKYVALVNPVNGQSNYSAQFVIRPPQVDVILATLTRLVVMESYPPQFSLSGTLPTICYQPQVSAPKVNGKVISVFVRGVAPKGMPCGEALRTFTKTVTIDPAKLGLAPGTYTVLFNPVNGESRFKTTITVR